MHLPKTLESTICLVTVCHFHDMFHDMYILFISPDFHDMFHDMFVH